MNFFQNNPFFIVQRGMGSNFFVNIWIAIFNLMIWLYHFWQYDLYASYIYIQFLRARFWVEVRSPANFFSEPIPDSTRRDRIYLYLFFKIFCPIIYKF